ncbi:MAG: DNA damage-inducible protein D [Candidatus Omnitrophica bacterium]|nr:DNA damage-inducible protein D [Candidatus Omnitrophota bacterium]MBU4419014.1 DNA damage-inducible protein D [Candidatus Omnitrophota bacterium]MBU4468423.1 DNA damage-inducible protein D [Candidatus Omnitrophota bacterium]
MNQLSNTGHSSVFESIKKINEQKMEYWSARELSKIFEYSEYRHFIPVIAKAKDACNNSGHAVSDHFEDILEMVDIGSGAKRNIEDVKLSRYACYLIVQNADPAKEIVALGQTYFAVQTRRQELSDEFGKFESDEEKRLFLRQQMKEHNKYLASAAKEAGVVRPLDYAIFQDHGYKGLYGGLGQVDIHRRKGLKKGQKVLDYMGSTELAANLFRATQAEDKLRRENIRGKDKANQAHFEVGKKVRQTIKELGGTMPESLPSAENIKKITSKNKRQLGNK